MDLSAAGHHLWVFRGYHLRQCRESFCIPAFRDFFERVQTLSPTTRVMESP